MKTLKKGKEWERLLLVKAAPEMQEPETHAWTRAWGRNNTSNIT